MGNKNEGLARPADSVVELISDHKKVRRGPTSGLTIRGVLQAVPEFVHGKAHACAKTGCGAVADSCQPRSRRGAVLSGGSLPGWARGAAARGLCYPSV